MSVAKPTKREVALTKARVAGYENDARAFTRLLVEARVNRTDMNSAWAAGAARREAGRG